MLNVTFKRQASNLSAKWESFFKMWPFIKLAWNIPYPSGPAEFKTVLTRFICQTKDTHTHTHSYNVHIFIVI